MTKYLQGRFTPVNPDKYKGDKTQIIFRSSWERAAMNFMDNTPEILAWNSEETIIPYYDPVQQKARRYFIDLKCWVKTHTGEIKIFLIEIKPKSQTMKPRVTPTKSQRTLTEEVTTWATNQAKWKAARAICQEKGWTFVIWHEDILFGGIDKGFKKKKK